MKRLLIILATVGFLAANSGGLNALDNFQDQGKTKKVKHKKDGSTTVTKKEVKNDGSTVKKTKKSSNN